MDRDARMGWRDACEDGADICGWFHGRGSGDFFEASSRSDYHTEVETRLIGNGKGNRLADYATTAQRSGLRPQVLVGV